MRRVSRVKVLRQRLRMTQVEFAEAFHLPITTLRDWEQRRSTPDAPARALLLAIERNPEGHAANCSRIRQRSAGGPRTILPETGGGGTDQSGIDRRAPDRHHAGQGLGSVRGLGEPFGRRDCRAQGPRAHGADVAEVTLPPPRSSGTPHLQLHPASTIAPRGRS